jgi:hypothetical protein
MLPPGTLSQPVWRIGAAGVSRVYFLGLRDSDRIARVNTRGQIMTWSLKPTEVSPVDLFMLKQVAREEYRKRKRAVLARNPHASTNVTTPLEA